MGQCKVIIIDHVHPELIERLEGMDVDYRPDIQLSELEAIIGRYQLLILRSKLQMSAEWIDKGSQLKLIGRLGSGMDNIDVTYAESKGIICLNAPEGNRDSVAEQTIGMLLSLLANIHRSSHALRSLRWERQGNSGLELSHRTVGIIGYGNVGQALAKRLAVFGCRILAYDLYRTGFGSDQVREVSLEELLRSADVISLHVPLNEHSRQMVNEDFLSKIPGEVFILNLSRGEIVDTDVLVQAVKSGKIKGLALDVFENENMGQLTDSQRDNLEYLANHPQVITTPHIGGLTKESYERLAVVLAKKINEQESIKSFC